MLKRPKNFTVKIFKKKAILKNSMLIKVKLKLT